MTSDALAQLAAGQQRERPLEAERERLAADARARRPQRRPGPGRFTASIGQLLAIRREAVTR